MLKLMRYNIFTPIIVPICRLVYYLNNSAFCVLQYYILHNINGYFSICNLYLKVRILGSPFIRNYNRVYCNDSNDFLLLSNQNIQVTKLTPVTCLIIIHLWCANQPTYRRRIKINLLFYF